MLAGLIFAVEEAEDRPGTLMATLPFGGMTLLEYQARLLFGAGAEHVLVAVGRMTPALLAAVNRAAKRHPRIEIVRSAEEAAEKIAPGSRVLVIADGLVTTDPVMDKMGGEGAQALLVTDDPSSPAAIERIDMRDSWAGIARISLDQLAEIAHMPEDYDFQSALLRVAAQSGAEHVPLTAGWLKGGHGVERTTTGLAARNTGVLAALTERRTNWADRWVFTRAARLILPELVGRNVPGWAVTAAGGVVSLLALVGAGLGWLATGSIVALAGTAILACGSALAVLRGEDRRAFLLESAIFCLFSGIILLSGFVQWQSTGSEAAPLLALTGVATQLLAERVPVSAHRWWASPSAQMLIFAPFSVAGLTKLGLAAVTLYAFATLAAAVESTRKKA